MRHVIRSTADPQTLLDGHVLSTSIDGGCASGRDGSRSSTTKAAGATPPGVTRNNDPARQDANHVLTGRALIHHGSTARLRRIVSGALVVAAYRRVRR